MTNPMTDEQRRCVQECLADLEVQLTEARQAIDSGRGDEEDVGSIEEWAARLHRAVEALQNLLR